MMSIVVLLMALIFVSKTNSFKVCDDASVAHMVPNSYFYFTLIGPVSKLKTNPSKPNDSFDPSCCLLVSGNLCLCV